MTDKQYQDFQGKGIISNEQNFEGFSPLKNSRQNLFWPCVMYEVEVQVDNSNLDIFERTILKLADCNLTKSQDVAEATNLEIETVAFIQNRLFLKGYLQDRIYLITEQGKEYLGKLQTEECYETEVICLFKNLLTGEFIDLVEKNPAKNKFEFYKIKDEENKDENLVVGKFSLPGDETKKGFVVVPDSNYEKFINEKPKTYELLRAIKKYNKNVSENEKDKRINLSKHSNAVAIKTREIIFVHTVGFATAGAEVYSTDAAGIGISDTFTNFIRNADNSEYPWIKKIIEGGKTKVEENANEGNKEKSEKSKPKFSYPKISKLICEAKSDLEEFKSFENKNQMERVEAKNFGEKIYYNCFTAIEYALQMYYSDYNDPSEEDIVIKMANENFRKINQNKIRENEVEDNIFLFSELAENIELNLPDNALSLLKVYPGKIKAMRERNGNEPELVPLLCLALAYANFDSTAPLCYLAKDEPNFVCDLFELKSLRDKTSIAHGPGLNMGAVSAKQCEETIDLVIYYIKYLTQKIKDDFALIDKYFDETLKAKKRKFSSYLEQRYEKMTELYRTFGFKTINNLPRILVQLLVTGFMTFDEKRFVAGSSCSVVQQFFEYAISSMLQNSGLPSKPDRNAKIAEQKCISAGFEMKNGKLPESLSTVNYKRINKAICGGGCDTLGAGAISFFLLVSEEELADIAHKYHNLVNDLDFLLKSRGHSDVREYSSQEMSTYKKIVTNIIKEVINNIE